MPYIDAIAGPFSQLAIGVPATNSQASSSYKVWSNAVLRRLIFQHCSPADLTAKCALVNRDAWVEAVPLIWRCIRLAWNDPFRPPAFMDLACFFDQEHYDLCRKSVRELVMDPTYALRDIWVNEGITLVTDFDILSPKHLRELTKTLPRLQKIRIFQSDVTGLEFDLVRRRITSFRGSLPCPAWDSPSRRGVELAAARRSWPEWEKAIELDIDNYLHKVEPAEGGNEWQRWLEKYGQREDTIRRMSFCSVGVEVGALQSIPLGQLIEAEEIRKRSERPLASELKFGGFQLRLAARADIDLTRRWFHSTQASLISLEVTIRDDFFTAKTLAALIDEGLPNLTTLRLRLIPPPTDQEPSKLDTGPFKQLSPSAQARLVTVEYLISAPYAYFVTANPPFGAVGVLEASRLARFIFGAAHLGSLWCDRRLTDQRWEAGSGPLVAFMQEEMQAVGWTLRGYSDITEVSEAAILLLIEERIRTSELLSSVDKKWDGVRAAPLRHGERDDECDGAICGCIRW